MKQYLSNLSWLVLSEVLKLPVEDTKEVIRYTHLKCKFGTLEKDCSPQVFKAMNFYIENYDIIENHLDG